MTEVNSRFFNRVQLASLTRLGNIYAPGNGRLPSFSETQCIEYIDEVLASVDPDDVQLLGVLLLVLRWVPLWLMRPMIAMMDHHDRYPEWMAGGLRLVSLGVKGVIMSLYFSGLQGTASSGTNVYDAMGYSLHCEPDA